MPKLNALIADDVESLRALLKTHLKKFDCQVVKEVDNGNKVIAAIQQSKPDIVFLDINMPGMDGLSIVKYLTEHEIHKDVWMISGETDQQTRDTALRYGAKGFIQKPFNIAALQQALEDYRRVSMNKIVKQNKCSVIIADDEPLMRQLLKSMLNKLDCEITYEFSDGKEVVNALHSDCIPDILFLDIEMPGLNGLDVLEIVKKEKIETFTIIVSAHGTFENVQTAMGAGADGFVVKPYSEKKIEQVFSKFINSRN